MALQTRVLKGETIVNKQQGQRKQTDKASRRTNRHFLGRLQQYSSATNVSYISYHPNLFTMAPTTFQNPTTTWSNNTVPAAAVAKRCSWQQSAQNPSIRVIQNKLTIPNHTFIAKVDWINIFLTNTSTSKSFIVRTQKSHMPCPFFSSTSLLWSLSSGQTTYCSISIKNKLINCIEQHTIQPPFQSCPDIKTLICSWDLHALSKDCGNKNYWNQWLYWDESLCAKQLSVGVQKLKANVKLKSTSIFFNSMSALTRMNLRSWTLT